MSISYASLKYKSHRNVPLQYTKAPFASSEICYCFALWQFHVKFVCGWDSITRSVASSVQSNCNTQKTPLWVVWRCMGRLLNLHSACLRCCPTEICGWTCCGAPFVPGLFTALGLFIYVYSGNILLWAQCCAVQVEVASIADTTNDDRAEEIQTGQMRLSSSCLSDVVACASSHEGKLV